MLTTKIKKAVKTAAKTTAKKADSAKECPKKAAVKKLIKSTAPKVSKVLFIDYPAAGEEVSCGHYSFRIGSPEVLECVKVSVNGGAWQDCRHAHGYWWYDWWTFDTGPCCAEASALLKGKEVKSPKRKFKVTL